MIVTMKIDPAEALHVMLLVWSIQQRFLSKESKPCTRDWFIIHFASSVAHSHFNHKNCNFLDCDWFKKTPILH